MSYSGQIKFRESTANQYTINTKATPKIRLKLYHLRQRPTLSPQLSVYEMIENHHQAMMMPLYKIIQVY